MSNSSGSTGLGLCGTIFVVLFLLRVFKIITISWWWVFLPLIVGFAFWVALFILILIFTKKK